VDRSRSPRRSVAKRVTGQRFTQAANRKKSPVAGICTRNSPAPGEARSSGCRDVFGNGAWLGDRVPVFPHAGQVHLNGFAHELGGFFLRGAGGDATAKVRDVRAEPGGGLLEQDGVFHQFKPACFKKTIPRHRIRIHRRMARDRDAPFFRWVLILAMAALEIH
jgi:hypothetical protein